MSRRARHLDPADAVAAGRLLDVDPVQNVYLRSELRLDGLRSGAWWAVEAGSGLSSLMAAGGLVVPWLGDLDDAPALAAVLAQQRPPQLITGPREQVHALQAARRGPRPREVRDPQPLMLLRRGELRDAGGGGPVARLGRAQPRYLDRLVVASALMHQEEMGVDPLAIDPAGWRFRMATLIDRGWSLAWLEDEAVVFKMELSAWTPEVCQVQGVWVAPQRRGQGVGRAGMAAVCATLLAEVPAVSLYVNHFNEPALRLYRSLGFDTVAELASLFF